MQPKYTHDENFYAAVYAIVHMIDEGICYVYILL